MKIDISDRKLYNEKYIDSIFTNHRYKIYYGSRDSGKSHAIAQKIVYHLINDNFCRVILIRKVAGTIKDSMYLKILNIIDAWGIRDLFHITKSPLEITCKSNKNSCIARGLDNPEKLKSLTDPTIIWLEEATECELNDFILVDTSIRCSDPTVKLQLLLSFNPIVEDCWINETFFPPSPSTYETADGDFWEVPSTKKNTYILHTTYKDNYWCPQDRGNIYEDLINLSDGNYHRVNALGLWGCGKQGVIFSNIAYQDEMPAIEDSKHYGFGMDLGFTNDPTTIVECCVGPEGKIYVKELTYATGLVNVSDQRHSIDSEIKKHEITSDFEIIADSAEPKSITELNDQGHNVIGVKKGKGSVNLGLEILRNYDIVVCGASPNLKKEFKLYTWKIDKDGRCTNTPIDNWNHAIDSIRYWAMHNLQKNVAQSGIIRGLW